MNKRGVQLSELLESAYDATAEPQRFEDLLTAAKKYLFEGEQGERIRTALPRYADADEAMDRRMASLARLLELELSDRGPDACDTFHARISVSPRNLIVTGNPAAAALMAVSFPCPLTDLPFDHQTNKFVEASLKPKAIEACVQDQIFLAKVEQPMPRSCLALIERPSTEGGNVEIAITFIHWSEDLLHRLRSAFGLTETQADILSGFLNHYSQKTIAEQRAISVETVRDHSRAILQKTNCRRMADVVQLCASIAYLLRQIARADNADALTQWKTPTDNMALLQRPGERTLAWYDHGQGKTAVLFVHGYIEGPFFSEGFLAAMAAMDVRLICPSRPGYGYSSPSSGRSDFDATTVSDAVALVDSLGLKKLTVVAHQGGTSHAFRIAHALGERTQSLLMIDGGIPIDEKRYLAHMNEFARIGAVTTKHAPSVMRMLMNIGLPIYKRRGIARWLHDYHKASPLDLASLNDPEVMRLCAFGCFHSLEQGGEAWVRDGASAMADWEADFDALAAPHYWLHPRHCPVMRADFVEQYLGRKGRGAVEIVPDAAFNIFYTHPETVADFIGASLKACPPKGGCGGL